jgi:hypothetical protein
VVNDPYGRTFGPFGLSERESEARLSVNPFLFHRGWVNCTMEGLVSLRGVVVLNTRVN